jgi:hypothetical protein
MIMKNSKKNSPMKKIIPSACMLAISAAMLSTSTYAWFSMSDTVSVTGMKLQATANEGLVITDRVAKTSWTTSKTVTMDSAASLLPVSTNKTDWAASKSNDFDLSTSNGTYTDLTLAYTPPTNFDTGEGIGASGGDDYVLLKNFYIKSTGTTAWDATLSVANVTAAIDTTKLAAEGDAAAKTKQDNLYKSLRVLVVANDGTHTESVIYAPISGYDSTIQYKGTGDNLTLVASGTSTQLTTINSIPYQDASAINVKMYMYFEGEDENCKSSNISGIDVNYITVSASFSAAANS